MPTSKTNASMAVLDTLSNLSATKVILDNKDLLPNLGCDIYDWMMKMICWIYSLIRWLRMGIFHLDNKEVEAANAKKKTYGRQHSWDGKVSGEFVPRHLPMRLAKQNHMTVSTTFTRSNKSKKK